MKLRDLVLICGSIIVAGLLIALFPRLLPRQSAEPPSLAKNTSDPLGTGSENGSTSSGKPDPSGKGPDSKPTNLLRVVVSRPKDLSADWRLYLDGKLVAGKAEPLAYRVVRPTSGCFEVYQGPARLLWTDNAGGGNSPDRPEGAGRGTGRVPCRPR